MAIKIGRKYIEQEIENTYDGKTLPNMFSADNMSLKNYICIAIVCHIVFLLSTYLIITYLGIDIFKLAKPDWKDKEIVFVLTENEAPPINKNTPFRSDKNSQAGGIHDPKQKISAPSSSPPPANKTKQAQAPKTPEAPKQVQQQKPKLMPKTVQPKVAQTPQKPAPQGISKPSKPAAPSQKPVLKPSAATPKPQMPKLAANPSSPFKVAVPNTGAPVGKGFSTSQGSASTGGGAQGTPSGSGKAGSGMPAPQFSTTKTASSSGPSGNASGKGVGRGSYGTGNMGNPGPGNPSGKPGIDAIKSPQWGPYMRELESKIKRNWHPPKGDQSKRVVLLFKIGKRGELLSVVVSKSSGSAENDQAAMQAVRMSAPFRALPPEFTGSSVDIDFTFDYNVLGASYR